MIRRGRCALYTLLVASMGAFAAAPTSAQWRVEVQAGRLQYDAVPDAATTSLAAGVSRSTLTSSVGASVGVPFTSGEPVWGAVQGIKRFETGSRLSVGVDAAVNAFGYHVSVPDSSRLLPLGIEEDEAITGWGAAAEVMPLVGWRGQPFPAEARAGVVSFVTSATGLDVLHRTAFAADGWIQPLAWNGFSARVEGRFVGVDEGGFPFAGVSLAWDGPIVVWGSVGRWFDEEAESISWDAGASLALGSRVALVFNGEHEELDPIYDTPARTTWGAGLRILLGETGYSVAEPVPAAYENGLATLRLEDDDVDGVPSVAGDFNEWTPQAMTRDASGDEWTFRVPLEPGVYHYAFVDEAGNWFVPEDTPGRRSDGMGGHVAVLVVEAE